MTLVFTASTLTDRYLYGPAVDQILADEQLSTGNTYFAATDNQGTVRDLLEYDSETSTTSVESDLAYTPFGDLDRPDSTGLEVATVNFLFGYIGAWTDPATGLQYHSDPATGIAVRWLDPLTQRWLTQDPTGLLFGGNPYEDVNNSPTNGIDQSGLCDGDNPNGMNPGSPLLAVPSGTVIDVRAENLRLAAVMKLANRERQRRIDAIKAIGGDPNKPLTAWQEYRYYLAHPERMDKGIRIAQTVTLTVTAASAAIVTGGAAATYLGGGVLATAVGGSVGGSVAGAIQNIPGGNIIEGAGVGAVTGFIGGGVGAGVASSLAPGLGATASSVLGGAAGGGVAGAGAGGYYGYQGTGTLAGTMQGAGEGAALGGALGGASATANCAVLSRTGSGTWTGHAEMLPRRHAHFHGNRSQTDSRHYGRRSCLGLRSASASMAIVLGS